MIPPMAVLVAVILLSVITTVRVPEYESFQVKPKLKKRRKPPSNIMLK